MALRRRSMGGLVSQFDGVNTRFQKGYRGCRETHKRAMKLLSDHFNYHAPFKKGRDKECAAPQYWARAGS